MQPSYDADDFMRRGFFGSIIGFRKRSSSKPEPPLPPKFVAAPPPPQPPVHSTNFQSSSSSVLLPVPVPDQQHFGVPQNRTEYDIYREIVSEAEYIERSSPTTPDFSCPTTPQPSNYYTPLPLPPQHPLVDPNLLMPTPPQSEMMHHPSQYHMVMSPLAPHPIPVDPNGIPLGTQCPMAPPPYSSFAPQSSSGMQQPPSIPQMANIPFDVKKEIHEHLVLNNGKQQMSIEDIVKLVVVALKDSQIEEGKEEEETPEEILRRKRIQNNLAAARYRKRQREARESAEQELGDLTKRNDELREQVYRMEREISQLKQAVLGRQ
ncbi:hypothetical protein L5515_014966 [Caenorhabditis briggsae]|uniref:BZIP domain-containing protein n=1 Tax=Caenorhabditis briggsae TaxID=6238 RepID=A0AAE9ECU6_CAEBR|nr:hypothetical protein L5515_014966 [Caenorhabditis briggsae]